MQVVFSRQNLETFDILYYFLLLNIVKLSTLKKVRFLTHPVLLGGIAAIT